MQPASSVADEGDGASSMQRQQAEAPRAAALCKPHHPHPKSLSHCRGERDLMDSFFKLSLASAIHVRRLDADDTILKKKTLKSFSHLWEKDLG